MADWYVVYERGRKSQPHPTKEAAMQRAGGDLRRMTPPQPSHIEGPRGERVSLLEIKAYYVTRKAEFA